MTSKDHFKQLAANIVMQDLFDCLFAEDFFESLETEIVSVERIKQEAAAYPGLAEQLSLPERGVFWQLHISKSPQFYVLVAVTDGITQSLQRVNGSAVYAAKIDSKGGVFQTYRLSPQSFTELLISALSEDSLGSKKGAELFLETIKETVFQTALSLDHKIDTAGLLCKSPADFFQTMEQWGSLRDRPYHPIAKAKVGLGEKEYQQYSAEFGEEIPLNWVAVDKYCLHAGVGVKAVDNSVPAQYLLSQADQDLLAQEMEERGISQTHIALPVHPWQLENYIREHFAETINAGTCQLLSFCDSSFLATSSLRSMAPISDSEHYLKLPMAVFSLGAFRYLPISKMRIGEQGENLLRQGVELDSILSKRLHICDESKWWAFMQENTSLSIEAPQHLSAMVRSYPKKLFEDGSMLIPMAALGTLLPDQKRHFFDDWITYRKLPGGTESVLTLFQEVCESFIDINLRMFRLGMLAEMHGQNVVLVWRDGQIQGVLLRDLDCIRVYVPWLVDNGLSDPDYRINRALANTLYHETPEELLFYLQTLGIQVNLRSIIEALSLNYSIEEGRLWQVLKQVLQELIEEIDFSSEASAMIKNTLFEESRWPLKLLVKPLINRTAGAGNMPFGKGEVQNPFHHIGS